MKVSSEFNVTKWNETKCGESENNMSICKVSAVFETLGEIAGKFEVEYLMHYTHYNEANPHNSSATYLGYMIFTGSINGKSGSFVLEDKGTYSSAGPMSISAIKPNTGTGDFKDISGTAKQFAEGGKMIIEIEYSI
ncbi:MAG: DUF3224 domain-containing protein [Chitinophagaceae bacterium]|jgi:hypothetical protein|nr:DUF3224 domain-containing protein [Chitinophagaceae bacterium]